MSDKAPRPDVYFASPELTGEELGQSVRARLEDCRKWHTETGVTARRLKTWAEYYNWDSDTGQDGRHIARVGEQGELSSIRVNQLRSLGQTLLSLTTDSPPEMRAEAVNSDAASLSQATLMDGLLDAYERDKRVFGATCPQAAEAALVLDTGYVAVEWDALSGDEAPEGSEEKQQQDAAFLEEAMAAEAEGKPPEEVQPPPPVKLGDLAFRALTAFEVVEPPAHTTRTRPPYLFVLEWANRFDLLAQHPTLADDIRTFQDDAAERRLASGLGTSRLTDEVAVWTLYHEKTPSVPAGRVVRFLGHTVLLDTPLPYDEVPVYPCRPADMLGTHLGYTSLYDLLPLQKAYNALTSMPLSSLDSHGVGAVAVPRAANITAKELGQGKVALEYDGPTPPQAINFTAIPGDVYKLRDMVRADMEQLSGVNATSRGAPPAGASGAAMVFLDAKTQQYANRLQAAYAHLLAAVGTAMVSHLKRFATSPRVALIAGRAKAYTLRSFQGDDLEQVRRVVVKLASPLMRSPSGRMEMAKMLMGHPVIGANLTAEQLITLVQTGTLDPLLENEQAELIAIKSVKEQLTEVDFARGADGAPLLDAMTGQPQLKEPPEALLTDRHSLWVRELRGLLASPTARQKPATVTATLRLIQQHIDFLTSPDPAVQAVLAIVGERSLAAPPPMPGGPGAPPSGPSDAPGSAGSEPEAPSGPRMPLNPQTGERAEAPPPVAA